MKKNIKTKDALAVYNVIKGAKYSKLDDADKIKVWKITRALKPVATKFDEDVADAREKFKPEGDFDECLKKAIEFERRKGANEPTTDVMTDAEYSNFIAKFKKYDETVNNAVKEFGEKDVEVDFEPLSEESFGKLMASNEWDMQQVTLVGDFIL